MSSISIILRFRSSAPMVSQAEQLEPYFWQDWPENGGQVYKAIIQGNLTDHTYVGN